MFFRQRHNSTESFLFGEMNSSVDLTEHEILIYISCSQLMAGSGRVFLWNHFGVSETAAKWCCSQHRNHSNKHKLLSIYCSYVLWVLFVCLFFSVVGILECISQILFSSLHLLLGYILNYIVLEGNMLTLLSCKSYIRLKLLFPFKEWRGFCGKVI